MSLFKEKNSLEFKGRSKSTKGAISLAIGIVAWIIFVALSIYSSGMQGNAENPIGIIALLDGIFTLIGVYYAILGFQERDVFYGLPIAGIIMNAILFIVYFYLYLMGLVIA